MSVRFALLNGSFPSHQKLLWISGIISRIYYWLESKTVKIPDALANGNEKIDSKATEACRNFVDTEALGLLLV